MKTLLLVSMIVVAMAFPVTAAQRTTTPDTAQKPGMADDTLKTADGEIGNIDLTAKTFTFKSATSTPGKVFYYDDKTQFTGAATGIQGLKAGSMVKVSYREKDGKNWATKVETQAPRKS